jgi:hypothetical protein
VQEAGFSDHPRNTRAYAPIRGALISHFGIAIHFLLASASHLV